MDGSGRNRNFQDSALKIKAWHENWPLRDSFAISRGSKISVNVVVVEIVDGTFVGRGESVSDSRYSQSVDQALETVAEIRKTLLNRLTRENLRAEFPANAARNAVDCALWDLEAKKTGKPVWKLAGLPAPQPVIGAYTLSLDEPENLAASAKNCSSFPLLKIKLDNGRVIEKVQAVREACPNARIIVDANEAWNAQSFVEYLPKLAQLNVEMIEQPLHADADDVLEQINSEIPLCADESFHLPEDLARLVSRYDIFNIKLDKTGGLTEAIDLAKQVANAGKQIMIGSMMATSLGLAPAILLTYNAQYVDLDSSIWLLEDRIGGLEFSDGELCPADRSFWG